MSLPSRQQIRGVPTTAEEFLQYVGSFAYERPDEEDPTQLERNVREINGLIYLARLLLDTEPETGRRVCRYSQGLRPTRLEDWWQFHNEVQKGMF